MKPADDRTVMDVIVQLLLLAIVFLTGGLCWLSFKQRDYWTAAFFGVLFLGAALGARWSGAKDTHSNIVDLEDRRRRELGAATRDRKAARRG